METADRDLRVSPPVRRGILVRRRESRVSGQLLARRRHLRISHQRFRPQEGAINVAHGLEYKVTFSIVLQSSCFWTHRSSTLKIAIARSNLTLNRTPERNQFLMNRVTALNFF